MMRTEPMPRTPIPAYCDSAALRALPDPVPGFTYELLQDEDTGACEVGRIDTFADGTAVLSLHAFPVVVPFYPSLQAALHAAKTDYGYSGCYVWRVKEYQ